MAKSKFTTLDNLSFQEFDENSELIPLMTTEDEKEINSESLPETLPILSLRNTVLFPGVVIPITAGRDKSIKLIDDANKGTKVIGVVSQKDETVEDPRAKDINDTGTVARILKVLKMPDGNTTVIIQGKKRFQITEVISEEPYINALISEVAESTPIKNRKEFSAIIDSIIVAVALIPIMMIIAPNVSNNFFISLVIVLRKANMQKKYFIIRTRRTFYLFPKNHNDSKFFFTNRFSSDLS